MHAEEAKELLAKPRHRQHALTANVGPRASRGASRRRPRLIALIVVVVLLLGIGGGGAFAYASLRSQATRIESQLLTHLQSGQAQLEAAKTTLKQANSTHDPKLVGAAKVDFINAKLQFLTATQIADGSSLLRQLEDLPSVGPMVQARHRAVDDVSQMGIQLSLAGLDLADLDGQLIQPTGGGQQGHSLLTMIGAVQSKIGVVRAELQKALQAADRIDMTVLPIAQRGTLGRARGSINQALTAIGQFQALVPVLTEVLGGNGTRNYLIEQVNPAELRPGGGFIGTYSVLRVNGGTLHLLRSGNATDLILPRATVGEVGYVAPPPPFEELIPGVGWSFIDSNFSPDFPSNAIWGEDFADPHLGMHVDAVVAIDYNTVAGLLSLTGPIAVPGYRLTLSATNFVPTVVQYDVESLTDPNAATIHKAILSAVAGPLLERIVTLSPSQWPALLSTLNNLAASRHLQVYFNNGDVEKTMTQYGWSGVMKQPGTSDYMMEVEANLGGTKANYFVTRVYTVDLARNGGALHHKVTVDITDSMPYAYRPNEYYRAYIRMFVNGKATATTSDLSYPHYRAPAPPPDTKMIDGWVEFHGYGHDRVVTFQWDTPWQGNGRGVEQVYWQKQPGTLNDAVTVTWHDGNGHTYKVSGDLSQDRVITLAATGVSLAQGQVGTAQLPSLGLG